MKEGTGAAALRDALLAGGVDVPDTADPDAVAALAAAHVAVIAVGLAEASKRAPFTPDEVSKMCREHEETVNELRSGPAGDVRALLDEIRSHLADNLETEGDMESEGSIYERGLVSRIEAVLDLPASADFPMKVLYRNYRGETALRTITPAKVWHGKTKWHPEPQWLLSAFDHGHKAMRDFAVADFLGGPGHHGS